MLDGVTDDDNLGRLVRCIEFRRFGSMVHSMSAPAILGKYHGQDETRQRGIAIKRAPPWINVLSHMTLRSTSNRYRADCAQR